MNIKKAAFTILSTFVIAISVTLFILYSYTLITIHYQFNPSVINNDVIAYVNTIIPLSIFAILSATVLTGSILLYMIGKYWYSNSESKQSENYLRFRKKSSLIYFNLLVIVFVVLLILTIVILSLNIHYIELYYSYLDLSIVKVQVNVSIVSLVFYPVLLIIFTFITWLLVKTFELIRNLRVLRLNTKTSHYVINSLVYKIFPLLNKLTFNYYKNVNLIYLNTMSKK
ncbi:hypothetical protein EI74_0236 [Mycoplasma testudineum]|uniref:Uncharacterized protein n=1 Tax=Mycoplasma testudineum TaxID=244584 RepID=A0A4R6IHT7_9MOLU|nr:hypothetical protein [Mycoplasma testudineum]OYD27040.1 hypothetical protein CG473_00095 [Mycoplasma testudineum]TDO21205.1 hypothetical protein EI74_0236 [Mycoplasma testudineum]